MHTFEQMLWVTKTGGYVVANPDETVPNAYRRRSLGKIASIYRRFGPKKCFGNLPMLPDDIKASILAIVEHQNAFIAATAAAVQDVTYDAEPDWVAKAGTWDDLPV